MTDTKTTRAERDSGTVPAIVGKPIGDILCGADTSRVPGWVCSFYKSGGKCWNIVPCCHQVISNAG